ncbi:MAG TPA: hypothetical protein VJT73_05455, partial [Polyangiaceae bacterium]|nr:hypothetical protein [Polyangiaceae bacterium]
MADDRLRHRTRIGLAWGFTALLIAVYFALPGGDENAGSAGFEPASPAFEAPPDTQKLEVIHVSPADIPPGGAFVITYGGTDDTPVRVFAGKDELAIVAKRPGSLVARLPAGLGPGRTKIRLRAGNLRGPEEVSGPYEIRVKAANWRKPFRNLVGSLALLVFGIGVFGRGAREAIGLRGAHRLARFAERGPAALAFGALVGTLVQSTAAAAGFLAGLVTSSLLAVAPAAAAFLGAQLGAAAAPLLVTGVLDPHGAGLLAIAIGVLWLALANDRRATSFGRLVLGAGLIAFA